MKRTLSWPRRWRDTGPHTPAPVQERLAAPGPSSCPSSNADSDEIDARIGALLRRVSPPLPLSPARQAMVEGRLGRPAMTGGWLRRRLRVALVSALIVGTGGVVFARRQVGDLWHRLRTDRQQGIRQPAPLPTRSVEAPSAVEAPRLVEAPSAGATVAPMVASGPADSREAAAGADAQDSSAASKRSLRPTRSRDQRSARTIATATPPTRGGSAVIEDAELARMLAPAIDGDLTAHQSESAQRIASSTKTQKPPAQKPILLPEPEVIRRLPVERPAPVVARTTTGPLASEATLLRRALESLRHDDDPAGALAALDQYQARFPTGLLLSAAQIIRVDGLLALGRKTEAANLLTDLDLEGHPRQDELQTVHGELVATSDCGAAVASFSAVLAREPGLVLAERALRGRIGCRLRQGSAAAAADLRLYLERHPDGPLADEARQRLGR